MFKNIPKDLNRSIRDKYHRRVHNLLLSLKEYEIAANERLINGGKIRNREETKMILEKVKELKSILPNDEQKEDINITELNLLLDSIGEEHLTEDDILRLKNEK